MALNKGLRRRLLAGLVAVTTLATITGCGGEGTPASPTPGAATTTAADRFAPQRAVATCLRENGWAVDFSESDGSYEVTGIPEAQASQLQTDELACGEEFLPEAVGASEVTPEQWTQMYTAELEVAECLRDEGYAVPEAPTEQAFVDSYVSGTGEPWSPYASVPALDDSEWNRLNTTCPQTQM